jgi:hypothetical protein
VKLLIFGGGFFILLAERGVMPKEGLWMVLTHTGLRSITTKLYVQLKH